MRIANRLAGIKEYYFSQKLREIDDMNKAGKQVINLGIGSPDLPPHPAVIQVLQEESRKSSVHTYQGYKGVKTLRQAMAAWYKKWYGVELDAESEILPLIGSKEGIMHICMTYLDAGDRALVPNPGYPAYRAAIALAGGESVEYLLEESNNWFPDLGEIETTGMDHIKLMFINYPHMPTGQLANELQLAQLVSFAQKHGILLVHDNPYSFILNKKPVSLLSMPGAKKIAIELNSLSKSHNMAGWRIGMVAGTADRINDILSFKSNMDSGMFLPLQLAAASALDLDGTWFDELNKVYRQRKAQLVKLLKLLQCEFQEDQAGLFIWAKIPGRYANGFEWSDRVLHEANVFITPGGVFGSQGDNYARVSLCSPEEKILEAVDRVNQINNLLK